MSERSVGARPAAEIMLSAVIACYRDEQAIPFMADRLRAVFKKIGCRYEIIFVNDGSPDNTQRVLEDLASRDRCIKVITHSRNFSSQSAFTSGMARARGDAVILLDGDLQDPPELIEEFFKKWQGADVSGSGTGYDVVYGERVDREMPTLWHLGYKAFYRVFERLSYVKVPRDAGDFSLIDRRVVEALKLIPERDRFIRGIRAWVGFRQIGVPYRRPERMFGKSTNNLLSNIRWAKKGIFSFSYIPLELISMTAAVISVLSAFAIVIQAINYVRQPHLPWGITTIIMVSLFLGSVQLLSLSVIAEYLAKVFEEVKGRPHYIVTKAINFDA